MRSLEIYRPENSAGVRLSRMLSKILPRQKNSLNSILISIRRNDVIKKYTSFLKNGNQKSQDKFDNSYELYIETINEYIMNKVYKRVKNGIADEYEKTILSKYYYILKLKDEKYEEYVVRKQKYLLRLDYYNLVEEKSFIDFKRMYEDKTIDIYKKLLEIFQKNDKDKTIVKTVLSIINSYCQDVSIRDRTLEHDAVMKYIKFKAEMKKSNIVDVITKNEMLIEVARTAFSQEISKETMKDIYMDLIKKINVWLNDNINKKHFNEVYNLLLRIIKKYNPKVKNPIALEKEYLSKDEKNKYEELEKYIEKKTMIKRVPRRRERRIWIKKL